MVKVAGVQSLLDQIPAPEALTLLLTLDGTVEIGKPTGDFGVLGQVGGPGDLSRFELGNLGGQHVALGPQPSGVEFTRVVPGLMGIVEAGVGVF
jgi:hypothetical protein